MPEICLSKLTEMFKQGHSSICNTWSGFFIKLYIFHLFVCALWDAYYCLLFCMPWPWRDLPLWPLSQFHPTEHNKERLNLDFGNIVSISSQWLLLCHMSELNSHCLSFVYDWPKGETLYWLFITHIYSQGCLEFNFLPCLHPKFPAVLWQLSSQGHKTRREDAGCLPHKGHSHTNRLKRRRVSCIIPPKLCQTTFEPQFVAESNMAIKMLP